MIKTPGRKPEDSPFKKRQLSSDAKIIITLIKKQPQTKEEICKETKISDRTFYRIISLLEEQQIVKCTDHTYALWYFDPLEERIEAAFSKLLLGNPILHSDHIVSAIMKPWPEIEAVTYKVAEKLGLTIIIEKGKPVFYGKE